MCTKLQLCPFNILTVQRSELSVGEQCSYFEDGQLLDLSASENFSGFNKQKRKQQFWDSSTQNCNQELIASSSFVINAHARRAFSQFFFSYISLAVLNCSENPNTLLFLFRSGDSAVHIQYQEPKVEETYRKIDKN